MTRLIAAMLILSGAGVAGRALDLTQAPTVPPARPAQVAFEAGQYNQAIQIVHQARDMGPIGLDDTFLAAQAFLRQNQADAAKVELGPLVASEDQVWRLTGQSAVVLADGNLDEALQAATSAIDAANAEAAVATAGAAPPAPGPSPPATIDAVRDFHAYYQLGLVKARREDWPGALEAFERATMLNPTFAYAYYYAGMAASRVQRPDRVAIHLERFLQLAPNAPERPAVMTLMRTIRGR